MNAIELFQKYSEGASRIYESISGLEGNIPGRVIHAWETGGLLVPSWKDGEPERLWLNVVGHMVAVGTLVHRLAAKLPVDLAAVTEGGLIHDWYKRVESEQVAAAKAEARDPMEANRAAELRSADLLRELGFSDQVIILSKATGDIGLERMMQSDVTLAEELVFWADCCVSNDKITTYERRFNDLLPHFEQGGRYDHVNAKFRVKYGRTHRQVYDSVVLPIQDRLAQLAEFPGDPNNNARKGGAS